MDKSDKTLTYEQAKELKFFCREVVGTRQMYYELLDKVLSFGLTIHRLDKTVRLIEDYFGEQLRPVKVDWDKSKETARTGPGNTGL